VEVIAEALAEVTTVFVNVDSANSEVASGEDKRNRRTVPRSARTRCSNRCPTLTHAARSPQDDKGCLTSHYVDLIRQDVQVHAIDCQNAGKLLGGVPEPYDRHFPLGWLPLR
jgi:hypothetical protein